MQVLQGLDGLMQHDRPPYKLGNLDGRQVTCAPGRNSSSDGFTPSSLGAEGNRPCPSRVLGPNPVQYPRQQVGTCLHPGEPSLQEASFEVARRPAFSPLPHRGRPLDSVSGRPPSISSAENAQLVSFAEEKAICLSLLPPCLLKGLS